MAAILPVSEPVFMRATTIPAPVTQRAIITTTPAIMRAIIHPAPDIKMAALPESTTAEVCLINSVLPEFAIALWMQMQTNNVVRVKFKDSKKYIFSSEPLTFQTFLECVAKKFNLPTINVKVFDDSKTEVDEESFEYLLTRPDLGVLEIFIPGSTTSLDDYLSSNTLEDTEGMSESDDTAVLIRNAPAKNQAEERHLAQMIEDILKGSPGGDKVINEYARTRSLSDGRRRDMVKILVAHPRGKENQS
nr:uncharacterized protein LOC129433557 [Misgurnus anguillicaudatus]